MVATRIGEGREFDPSGLGEMDLSGLSQEAAGELLAASGVASDEAVARFHAATGGNPLALLELPRWLGGVDTAATGAVEEPVRVGEQLEAAFAARAEALAGELARGAPGARGQ